MAQQNPGFEIVGGTETEPSRVAEDPNKVAVTMIMLGLKALSQRALTAISDLFTLITVGSAFWLWSTIPAPNDRQIASLTIYALFVLAANVIVRRK